jgi:hypothetical protein
MVWKTQSLLRRAPVGLALLLAVAVLLLPADPARVGAQEPTGPSITLSPTTAQPNQGIALTGRGFTPGGGVTLAGIAMGGAAVPAEKVNFDNAVTIDHGGGFAANLIVPVSAATLGGGSRIVVVTDSAGKSASAALTIPEPALSVSPASSRVAGVVTVTGSNFPRYNGSIGADDVPQVVLEYEVAANQFRRVATATPDGSGSFAVSFTVPAAAVAPSSENQIRASTGGVAAVATAKHSMLGASFTASPAAGPAGATVSIQGGDFMPFAPVQSLRLGSQAVEIPGGIYTNAAGGFSASFQVPPADGGAHPLLLTVGGQTYSQVFTVEGAAAPAIPAEYTPAPVSYQVSTALRPLGDNLLRVFYFDNATKEWSFFDPRPQVADFNTLTELVEGEPYWIGVRWNQDPIMQGRIRSFVEGWNLLVW